jgi:hypothetical protein
MVVKLKQTYLWGFYSSGLGVWMYISWADRTTQVEKFERAEEHTYFILFELTPSP